MFNLDLVSFVPLAVVVGKEIQPYPPNLVALDLSSEVIPLDFKNCPKIGSFKRRLSSTCDLHLFTSKLQLEDAIYLLNYIYILYFINYNLIN